METKALQNFENCMDTYPAGVKTTKMNVDQNWITLKFKVVGLYNQNYSIDISNNIVTLVAIVFNGWKADKQLEEITYYFELPYDVDPNPLEVKLYGNEIELKLKRLYNKTGSILNTGVLVFS